MTERVVVRQMGQLSNLITPQGTMKTVGTSSEGLILEEHVSPTAELPDFQFLTHTIGVGHTTTPFSMFWKENGLEKAAPVGNGTLFLSTAKLQAGVRWTGLMRMDVLSIGILVFRHREQVCREWFQWSALSFQPVLMIRMNRNPTSASLRGKVHQRPEPHGRCVCSDGYNHRCFGGRRRLLVRSMRAIMLSSCAKWSGPKFGHPLPVSFVLARAWRIAARWTSPLSANS